MRPAVVLFWLSMLVAIGSFIAAGATDGGTVPVVVGTVALIVLFLATAARIDAGEPPTGRHYRSP